MAEQITLTEIQKFKKILEYFVLHMSANCNHHNIIVAENKVESKNTKENAILSDKLVEILNTQSSCGGNFIFREDRIEQPQTAGWVLGGHGYKISKNGDDSKLQKQLFSFVGNSEDIQFTVLNIKQKICISIDTTGGYKKGSYLHWVDSEINKEITQHTAGTNINPIFEKKADDKVVFVGLEVGPSQNSPTFVFPPIFFTFDELGLFSSKPSDIQKFNLRAFFEYFIEMRRYEIKGGLTYKGEQQLLATKNMILTGAPGTGKTWSAKNIASWMICKKPYAEIINSDELKNFKTQCKFVQFHPSYDYTDFVEGLRPIKPKEKDSSLESIKETEEKGANGSDNKMEKIDTKSITTQIGFDRVDGIFKDFCKKAKQAQSKDSSNPPYVMIIDEINRGEMSKILGEFSFQLILDIGV